MNPTQQGVTHAITAMGASGDGVAETPNSRVFVPFTLPGERAKLAINGTRADATAIIEPSADRVEPPCPHFTACGGCALQHWRADAYQAWKRGLVVQALAQAGVAAEVGPLVAVPAATRRRATFSVQMARTGLAFGFRRAMSHAVEPISTCVVAAPAIMGRMEALKALAAQLAPLAQKNKDGAFHLTVTVTDSGLDIRADDVRSPDEPQRKALVSAVLAQGFARLSIRDEVVVSPREPVVVFDGIAVTPPPGGFLQAAVAAEHAMQAIVGGYLDGARRVADLFSGSGTFALPLARRAAVHAVESDAAALVALDRAWRGAARMKPLTVERRDLFMRPLTSKELEKFDAVVIDPPRAGAEAQMRQLAKSSVKRIAAVSCNPVTLARDLRLLADGGFKVLSVTPVDQFLWSAHVEAVALLARG